MSARAEAQCGACQRYRSPMSPENTLGLAGPFCAAFPGGIPDDIWHNRVDHRKPVDGDHGLQWISREGAPFPTYAMVPGAVGDNMGVDDTLTAAAGAISGAMLALVPSTADAARLALPPGEADTELHCTLIYLGEAEAVERGVGGELLGWVRAVAEIWSGVEARVVGPALFNRDGDEPCVVLVLSGPDLAEFHETAVAEV